MFALLCFVIYFFFAAGFTKFSQNITLENLLISSFPEMLWQALTWRLRTPKQVRPTWILYYYEVKTFELSSEWCLKNVQGIPKTFYWIVDVKKLSKNCPKNNFLLSISLGKNEGHNIKTWPSPLFQLIF